MPPCIQRSLPASHSADLGGQARSYDELRALASNYARQRLAGLTVVNYPTQLAITLGNDGLKAATIVGRRQDC